jgi:hypothetical protein
VSLPFHLDRDRPEVAGAFRFTLAFTVDGKPLRAAGTFTIPEPRGPLIVRARASSADGPIVAVAALERTADAYALTTPPGTVHLEAWSDENRDGEVGSGDLFGRYPTPIDVAPGESLAGIDLTLERLGPSGP